MFTSILQLKRSEKEAGHSFEPRRFYAQNPFFNNRDPYGNEWAHPAGPARSYTRDHSDRKTRALENRKRSPAPRTPLPSEETLEMKERLAKCEAAAKGAELRQRNFEERI